jgi:CubicO group peptidase (beta-lactamase class C family)
MTMNAEDLTKNIRIRALDTENPAMKTGSLKMSGRGLLPVICVTVALFLAALMAGCSDNPGSVEQTDNTLEYVTPEEVGYSSEALEMAEALADEGNYAAVMALSDGKVFFSYGDISGNYKCHSIRKPFLSAIFGIHVGEGHIYLDATLEDLGIDDTPTSLTQAEKQARVRDLLKSRSGVYILAAAEAPEMEAGRPERGSHPPDTYYWYNNWDFNALGTIFEQETGTKIFEEFKSRIADVVGMEDFSIDNCFYQLEAEKSMHPAYHFRMSARDMARFGVVYQNDGVWRGRRIIPSEWIEESLASYSLMDSTFEVGYGYLWMTAPEGTPAADLFASPCFFHTGAGVHLLVVWPDLRLVVVIRLDTDGAWVDPGDELQMELIQTIVNARVP